jgi:beta-lactamase superfamily II metal-dependent hydrolase
MQVFRRGWFLFVCIAILVAANVSIYRTIFAPHALEVSVLDVGKAIPAKGGSPDPAKAGMRGSAVLVRTPSNMLVLIDTGPDASVLRALGAALPPWRRHIDAVILTGTKASSVGGLPEVESRYRVSTLVRIGGDAAPYGSSIVLGDTRIEIITLAVFTVSSGATSLRISSTTPAGAYTSDGQIFVKK